MVFNIFAAYIDPGTGAMLFSTGRTFTEQYPFVNIYNDVICIDYR